MQSEDPRIPAALEALALPHAKFRAMIRAALVRAERFLAAATLDRAASAERARVELGRFAEERIDAEGLTGLTARQVRLEGDTEDVLRNSIAVLRDALKRETALYLGEVPPGGELGATVNVLLTGIGRAIVAVRETENRMTGQLGRVDRRLIPPLIVAVRGVDLHPAALMDYCGSGTKFVLVVEGPCAPAALVRLITPGTLVLQTSTTAGLARFAEFDGPAFAGLVSEPAACFLHDPEAGNEPWERMRIDRLPDARPRVIGSISVWQQAEDLRQLSSLTRGAPSTDAPPSEPEKTSAGAPDAVERLTAWLLACADSP
jgi:hypothetical protein